MIDPADIYLSRFGLRGARLSRIDHEEAIVADVYRVDGEELILKICVKASHYRREIACLELLRDVIPVPKICQHAPPEGELPGAILMERLPGTLLSLQPIGDSLAFELGRDLALIHSTRFAGYGEVTGEVSHDSPLPGLFAKLEESIEECQGHLPAPLLDRCRQLAENQAHLISKVDGPCLVHRDFRPGNILVDGETVTGIIDWAGARAGFAEEDFHSDWLGENRRQFLEGYAAVRPIPNYAPLVDYLRLHKALAVIGFTLKQGTWNTRDDRLYQTYRKSLAILTKTGQ